MNVILIIINQKCNIDYQQGGKLYSTRHHYFKTTNNYDKATKINKYIIQP